ncbi:MAG: hypothetical protein Q4C58_07030 [Eubacteriales bacterium]|nr:hypothetical protein [Eubacteriales bacterium]
MKKKNLLPKDRWISCLLIAGFCLYFFASLFIVRDYGVSTDEPQERKTMYVNANYVLTKLGRESMEGIPELDTYKDKYYGVAMQMPMAVIELLRAPVPFVYFCRHMYTFSVCLIGYAAFFLLCKRIFHSNMLALLGTVMIALYPRFFAEQFYNVKDMIFVAMYMISMWATVQLIESNFSKKWVFLFSIIVALTTNVRIVGFIFMGLVIGYLWVICVLNNLKKIDDNGLTYRRSVLISVIMIALYFVVLVISMPGTWSNPLQGILDTFIRFSDYPGGGNVVFMGEVMENTEIPWYYIPVWMLISIPIWYILLFFVAVYQVTKKTAAQVKNKEIWNTVLKYKYLIWSVCLAAVPWITIAVKGANLYNGWRHCYFLVPPIILFVLYGVDAVLKNKKKTANILLGVLIAVGLLAQVKWIYVNHPYEMVYFNRIGRLYAADFDRDYWHLSEIRAWEYIAAHDDSEKITVNTSGYQFFTHVLWPEEKARVIISDNPDYYIETYRGKVGNECSKEGYEEFYSIVIDGFKVATIFKKL